MATEYTIYLVNESASTQLFWCFLQRPEELVNDPNVFANSSTQLAVAPNSPSVDTFTIPVQYSVGAGASNQAVGLNIKVESSVSLDAELEQKFDAVYVNVPPPQGPTLIQNGSSPTNTIAIKSNGFDQVPNEGQGWFANQSFGIQTAQGYIGMSWSPSPDQTRTLTPTLKFYVAVGTYGNNTLASWNQVSNNSAELVVPNSFQFNKATVTYGSTGSWTVTPGEPTGALPELSPSPFSKQKQEEELVSVIWDEQDLDGSHADTFLSGTLTVSSALVAGFAFFILGGINFHINSAPVGGTTVSFTYSGSESAETIKKLFVAGAEIWFRQSG